MGKIGSYEYPDWKLRDCIEIAKIIEEKFGGKVENQDTLAEVMKHKTSKSGGYISKITACRRYGLVTGRGALTTTNLAKSIIYPKPGKGEKERAIVESFVKVELFRRIYERLKEKIPSDDFWVDLVEITGVERSFAQKEAIKIRNLYIEGHQYLISMKPEVKGIEEPARPFAKEVVVGAFGELKTTDYGTLVLRDEGSIGVARNILTLIETKLKESKKTKKD